MFQDRKKVTQKKFRFATPAPRMAALWPGASMARPTAWTRPTAWLASFALDAGTGVGEAMGTNGNQGGSHFGAIILV